MTPQEQEQATIRFRNWFNQQSTTGVVPVPAGLMEAYGGPTSTDYVIKDGQLITKGSLSRMEQLAADPNMTNIGTVEAPKYVPKGSPGELLATNPQAYAQQYPTAPVASSSSQTAGTTTTGAGVGGVTGTLPNGQTVTFIDEATARQYGATNIQVGGGQQQPGQGQTGQGGQTEGGATSTMTPTGNPEMDALLQRIDQMIQQQAALGNQINPNIEITPQQAQAFLDQAEKEIEPYYANIFRSVKDDLTRNLEGLQKKYELDKQSAEATFKQQLGAQREQAAGAGLTFSGVRAQGEQQTAAATNRSLESAALAASEAGQNAIRSTERNVGSRNLEGLTMPNLNQYSVSLEGQGGFTGGRSLDFSGLGGVTGTQEYAKRGDVRSLTDFLKQQEIQKRTLSFGG